MKKNILLLLTGLTFLTSQAQETTQQDALRFAVENITGTARFRSMGGAFGALGGDLSALNQNPAGSIFFNNNYATATITSYNTKNSSSYFGTKTKENNNSLDLNQAGVVFVFTDANSKTDWKKFTIALNYENNNNFNNSIFSAGINPYNSISQYFVNQANALGGIPLELLKTLPSETYADLYNYLGGLPNGDYPNINGFQAQQAFFGYQGYAINPVSDTPGNTLYTSNVPTSNNYYQDYYDTTSGYSGKGTINFATTYKDIISLGVNLNLHFTDLTRTTSVYEDYDINDLTKLQSLEFATETHTFGQGFSFNLGAIVKATKSLRLGLSYESPTWYRLEDEQRQLICADCYSQNNEIIVDPNIIMIYPAYKIQTPNKWTGSAAYIFGKKGLLSVDVSTKDYSTTRFKPKNDKTYSILNNQMKNNLDKAIEVRVGGEYKIKQVSLRGGYHFDESPYKIDQTFGDLTGYSAGIGYNFGESRLDLAYAYEHRKMNQTLISSGMTDPARISQYNNNVTLSYSVNF
jgi:hypothetical protein